MNCPEKPLSSEQLLGEIKQRQLKKDVVDVEEGRVKIVIFRSGAGRYAFYGHDIQEIIGGCEISWVPHLPPFLPGLIHVRGDIESVIDIQCFLRGEGVAQSHGLIAMAVRDGFRSGILVDAVEDVVDIPLSAIKPPLSTLSGPSRELVAGELELGEALIPLLDLEKLAAKVTL